VTAHRPAAQRQIRVVVTGASAAGALAQSLARHPELELVGEEKDVRAAGALLAERAHSVVLHAVSAGGDADARDRVGHEVDIIREHSRAPIVLLVPSVSPELVAEALAAGVADVLVVPRMLDTVAFAVQKAVRAAGAGEADGDERSGQVITVFSPKGGTGKTVLSTNLAAAAARRGLRVLLVDLDLQFGDACMMFGLTPERTISDLVAAPGELDGEKLSCYTARHACGVEVLAAPPRPEDAEAVTEAKVQEVLAVARETYDLVVLDTSPFFYGPLLATLEPTDRLLLLCGLDAPTMKNVRLGVRTLELLSFRLDRVDVVLNRVAVGAKVTRSDVESVLELPIAFELPEDPVVLETVNRGEPATLGAREAAFTKQVDALATAVVSALGRPSRTRGAGESLTRRLLGRRA
jgi:pilus assembly protein CpaE